MSEETPEKRTIGTPFKLGNPGGPGRPKLPEEIKEARKFTAHEVEILFTRFIQMTREELAAVKTNPESTLLELIMHSIFTHGINKGDQVRLEFVLNRIIGKAPDKISVTSFSQTVNTNVQFSEMVKNPEILEDLIKIETKLKSIRLLPE